MPHSSLEARFWVRVDRSGGPDACWPWLGSVDRDGYGKFSVGRQQRRAHRVADALANGPHKPGEQTLHRCDNPPCCNPGDKHLFRGTNGDNSADMKAKGRQARGERTAAAKLTAADVRAIRGRYGARAASQRELATEFGVTQRAVWAIIHHLHWSHVAA